MILSVANECAYLGICLAGFFFGIYSGIFILYLQYHTSKTGATKTNNILFYALCLLYVLSAASIGFDIGNYAITTTNVTILYVINIAQYTLFVCCDFIAQSILIYRCWIVWGQNIYVVIVPSILALTFAASYIASIIPEDSEEHLLQPDVVPPAWIYPLSLTGLTASMVVNALVTGLIVYKIFKVFRLVRPTSTGQTLGPTGGRRLSSVMYVIIESGMILFSIQLARFATCVVKTDAAFYAFQTIVYVHEVFNGITPTIILVRMSMGLSFHDETELIETQASCLHFAPNRQPDSMATSDSDLELELGGTSEWKSDIDVDI